MQRNVAWARVLVFVLVIFPILGSVHSVSAQGDASTPAQTFVAPKFSIQPAVASETSWLQTELAPGDSVDLAVIVTNYGEVTAELRTYSADAYSMVNGGFSVYDEGNPQVGSALWTTYEAATFTLDPGESVTRNLTVNVPADALPGQYVSGLVVKTATPLQIPGSTTFSQIIKSSMAVEVNVPGERKAEFHLGQPIFSANESVRTLEVPVINAGNILVKPEGTLTIVDATGVEVMSADVEMGSVYAGMEAVLQVSIPMQFALGTYSVALDLVDEVTGVTASLSDAKVELISPLAEEQPSFAVEDVSITANADPIQYANITATIANPLQAIPTANVTLAVQRDGVLIEEFALSSNLAIGNGETPFEARYIPQDGWTTGTYSFAFEISAVNAADNSETVLASIDVTDKIVVP